MFEDEDASRVTVAMVNGKAYWVYDNAMWETEVNEDGEPVFAPQRTNDAELLTFHEPTGASLMAVDRKKKNEEVES